MRRVKVAGGIMTLNRWFVVLVSTGALAGCKDTVAPVKTDLLTARWAGASWVGEASATIVRGGPAGDTLYFFADGPIKGGPSQLFADNEITARVLFAGVGTYRLGPGDARFMQLVGGDVVSATYSTSSDATGSLVIESYGGIGGKIEGTISFDAVSSNQYRSFGDRASLEDGRFRGTVYTPPIHQ
jgi:hypothetical protein